MRIQPYDYTIVDGEVFEVINGGIRGTGIFASFSAIEGRSLTPLFGYSLTRESQIENAAKTLKNAYPNATTTIVSNEIADGQGLALIGGLATSNIWISVNGKVGVHPLVILLRSRKGTLRALDTEFSKNGILADIL